MHKYMFMNPDYGIIGLISFPYFLFFEYLTPFIEILGLLTITLSFLIKVINIEFFVLYMLLYIFYNMLISINSLVINRYLFLEDKDADIDKSVYLYVLLEAFGYRQLTSIFRIGSIFRGKKAMFGEIWNALGEIKILIHKKKITM